MPGAPPRFYEGVQAAAMVVLADEALFTAAVKSGIEQADRGEFVEHDEVMQRIDRLFRPSAHPLDNPGGG